MSSYKGEIKVCTFCGGKRSIERNRKICAGCRDMIGKSKKENGVLPPEYEDVTIAKYKEPMEKVEGGHGYYGAITQSKDGKYLQCHICGFFFPHLANHVRKHDITGKEYKEQFGLRLTEGLLGEEMRQKFQDSFNALVRATNMTPSEFGKNASIKAHEVLQANEYKNNGGNQWKAITRNERGNCRDQTLVKLRTLAADNEGSVNEAQFMKAYGQGQDSVIRTHFGTFDNALREAHLSTRLEQRLNKNQMLEQEAVDKLKLYYDIHGRSPQWSDVVGTRTNVTGLPSANYIKEHFRSMNNYRFLAGIPLILQGGKGWHTVMPGTQEYSEYQMVEVLRTH